MFQLTRQEQLILAMIMFALIVGVIMRLYTHSQEKRADSTPLPSRNSISSY